MPEKDFREKRLEDFDDVFSDIVNVLLFHGKQRVNEHDLESGMLRSGLKTEEKFEEQERDDLFEIAFLSDEQVNSFKSDFRYVAEYFVANRKRKEGQIPQFTITSEHLKHVEEFCELMNALTNSDRFSHLPKLFKERGGSSMYTILFDEAETRGEKRGEIRGEKRGEAKGEQLVVGLMQKLYALGRNEDAQKAIYDEKYRKKLYEEFKLLEQTNR